MFRRWRISPWWTRCCGNRPGGERAAKKTREFYLPMISLKPFPLTLNLESKFLSLDLSLVDEALRQSSAR
jgi:hypothetical protein